jgi:hypothetical protein
MDPVRVEPANDDHCAIIAVQEHRRDHRLRRFSMMCAGTKSDLQCRFDEGQGDTNLGLFRAKRKAF